MKRLKALIKMEMKPALLVGIYFLIVNLISIGMTRGNIASSWRGFLINGIEGFIGDRTATVMSHAFIGNMIFVMLFNIIGMLLMVYVSFKNDKSIEVGRFLKSLPYTMKERCLTKVGVGISVFTVTYLLFTVGMVILRIQCLNQFNEVYKVTAYAEVYQTFLTSNTLLQTLLLGYIVCVGIYLFTVMFEYLISPNLASIIVAALVYLSPVFITVSLEFYIPGMFKGLFEQMTYWLQELLIILGYERRGIIIAQMNAAAMDSTYNVAQVAYIGLIGYKIAFYGVVALVSLFGILRFSQKNCMEQSDLFIPFKGFRNIFIAGVTVCGGLLAGDIYCVYNNTESMIMAYAILMIGGIVSFLIARKIASIGIKKTREGQA